MAAEVKNFDGHDAEVTCDEPCVQIDFSGFGAYAKRQ
jgi:hypothetical protein